jgi:serine phosphatase RsbU (regulator of sigma subunit)
MSLLIVDDSRVAQFHLRTQLASAGFDDVIAADSGEAAVDLLSREDAPPVDLLLLDVLMPGLDGVETCRRLKQIERLRDVPVIMVTAETETALLKSAFDAGAVDYITKPADDVELIARVGSALKLRAETEARKARERELEAQRRLLEAELARPARVQADLLPREAPALEGYDIAARCLPARDVGGDFYDWQPTAAGGITFTLGDVMGKGMPAALLMATVRAALRPIARNAFPADAVAAAGAALDDDLTRAGSFVTLFHARLDPTSGRVDYVDAGHGYAVVRRAGGEIEALGPRGLPLGLQHVEY